MASAVIAQEWLNQNSLRNYPFRENCGLRPNDSAGSLIEDGWRLPNYLVTDLVLGVNGANYDPTIYLKRLSVVAGNVTLVFADAEGEDVFTVGAIKGEEYKQIAGVGKLANSRGVIHFGNLSQFFDETPEGLYTFSMEESLVEPTCIRPSAAGVCSLAVVDAAGYATAGLQGDVKLVAGDNINLSYDTLNNAIIISADPSSGYTSDCACEDKNIPAIRTINGIPVEDVVIEGDDGCVKVEVKDGVIKISDTCSKPCCGCAETTFINQTINDLRSSVTTLETNATILSQRITSFVNNYLLARKTLG